MNGNQENFVQSVSENEREFHELLFSYGNGVYIYHSLEIEPTLQDYEKWLKGLDKVIQLDMEKKVLKNVKRHYLLLYISEKEKISKWKNL